MRILFLTPRFPCPPDRGDKVRPFNFARVLAKEHTLGLVSFVDQPITHDNETQSRNLFSYIRTVNRGSWSSKIQLVKHAVSSEPWQNALFRSPEMFQAVKQSIKEFSPDVIYTFHLRMAQYTVGFESVFRILDLCDSVSLFLNRMRRHRSLFLRPLIIREERAVRKYERKVAANFDEVWLISRVDLESIPGSSSWENLQIIPNGVDTNYFHPPEKDKEVYREQVKRIIFVGYMGAESISAIDHFSKNIYPKIKQIVPDTRFLIVGKNPPNSVLQLANDPSIEVAGYVEDLASCYRSATVSVAPMEYVVGIQNKVLESMACGVPVVATPFANEGIDAEEGKEISIAENADLFAKKVCDLLLNYGLNRTLSKQGRDFVTKKYRWEKVADRMRVLENRIEINQTDKIVGDK